MRERKETKRIDRKKRKEEARQRETKETKKRDREQEGRKEKKKREVKRGESMMKIQIKILMIETFNAMRAMIKFSAFMRPWTHFDISILNDSSWALWALQNDCFK